MLTPAGARSGRTPATSPAVGVEVNVVDGRVWVVHWLSGQPFWVVRTQAAGEGDCSPGP